MKYSKLKIGDILTVDGGFSCMTKDEKKIVHYDDAGFYVDCNYGEGKHYLMEQKDKNDNLIGFEMKR